MKRALKSLVARVMANVPLTPWVRQDVDHLTRACCLLAVQHIMSEARSLEPSRLIRSGFQSYSGYDDDGAIREVFQRIGAETRYFVEIGARPGTCANTTCLLIDGWRGVWLDSNVPGIEAMRQQFLDFVSSGDLSIAAEMLTAENVEQTLANLGVPAEIDLLSIDIDGNDYHVVKAIQRVRPRVFVVEYNAKHRPQTLWVMKYNAAHRYDGTDYFGASLKSFELLMRSKGYPLVGCNMGGTNAFFVREDLVTEQLFRAPFSAENHYEPYRYILARGMFSGHPPRFGPFERI
jgi:hypothetical protein